MRKGRKSSCERQQTVLCSEQTSVIHLDHQNVKKMLQECYKIIRTHVKQKILQFQEPELANVYKLLSRILKIIDQKKTDSLQNYYSSNQNIQDQAYFKKIIQELKQRLQKQKQKHSVEVRELIANNQAQISHSQKQYNQKIMNISKQFIQKEVKYQQLITKFNKSLTISKESFQKYQKEVHNNNQKQQKTILTLTDQIKKQKSQLYNYFLEIIENSKIKIKNKENINFLNKNKQNSKELDNSSSYFQESSFDIQNSLQKLKKIKNINQNGQKKSPNFSPIVKALSYQNQSSICSGFQQLIQRSLLKLISFGFFSEQNQSNCKSLLSMSKNSNHYSEILTHNLYPLVLQNILRVLQKNEDFGFQFLSQDRDNKSQLFKTSQNLNKDGVFYHNGKISDFNTETKIQFRDIQNLQDLDVSDSVL